MVLRQHWLPPHPSFERPDSELQPGAMPQGAFDVSAGETAHAFSQPENAKPPALGRATQETHWFPAA